LRPQSTIVLVVSLVLLATALIVSATPAQGQQPLPQINATELGLAFINSAEDLRSDARIRRGVATGARMDRFPLYWNYIEKERGLFDWTNQDAALRANERNGLSTLAVLLGTSQYYYPSDLSRQADPFSASLVEEKQSCSEGMRPPALLYEPIFADGTDVPAAGKELNPHNFWARFVHESVSRYRPGGTAGLTVRHWEIWNEPDLCEFWTGSAREYARLLKVAYIVIKRVDPQATVIWGGLAHHENQGFLPALVDTLRRDPMAAAHNGFFDAAASHHYADVDADGTNTLRIRQALAAAGWQNKPIWITESGVPVCGDDVGPACPSPHRADAEGQASFIWQNIANTRLAGGGPIFHFQLSDDCGNDNRSAPPADAFGLSTNEAGDKCVPHQAKPRLSYTAYQLATRFFPNTEILWEDTLSNGVRRVAFYHPATKERRVLLWATGADSVAAHLPATGAQARIWALDGSYVDAAPTDGNYHIPVPGSTNMRQHGSATYIGGKPYLFVEKDIVPPAAEFQIIPHTAHIFEVAWQVSDLGSGLAPGSVQVWVQVQSDPWRLWLDAQPPAGGTFAAGTDGYRYRFAIRAADRAGNALTALEPMAEIVTAEAAPEPAHVD
jgi:hypothetical protein